MDSSLKFRDAVVNIFAIECNHDYEGWFDIQANEFYTQEHKHFGQFDKPVVIWVDVETYIAKVKDTKTGKSVKEERCRGKLLLLSNKEVFLAAKEAGAQKIKVVILKGLLEKNIPRFINYSNFYKGGRGNYLRKYQHIKFLKKYLTSKDGQDWAASIKGDTDEKISAIMNLSTTTIKNIVRIGNRNQMYLSRLDKGHAKLTHLAKKINEEEAAEATQLLSMCTAHRALNRPPVAEEQQKGFENIHSKVVNTNSALIPLPISPSESLVNDAVALKELKITLGTDVLVSLNDHLHSADCKLEHPEPDVVHYSFNFKNSGSTIDLTIKQLPALLS